MINRESYSTFNLLQILLIICIAFFFVYYGALAVFSFEKEISFSEKSQLLELIACAICLAHLDFVKLKNFP